MLERSVDGDAGRITSCSDGDHIIKKSVSDDDVSNKSSGDRHVRSSSGSNEDIDRNSWTDDNQPSTLASVQVCGQMSRLPPLLLQMPPMPLNLLAMPSSLRRFLGTSSPFLVETGSYRGTGSRS